MKRYWRYLGIMAGVLLMAVLLYATYVLLSYHRIEDGQELSVREAAAGETPVQVKMGESYGAITYNVGFGAYLPEFSFFMDGGTQSRAESAESVHYAIEGAAEYTASYEPDFIFLQEVDLDSTRSHHVNEYELFCEHFEGMQSTFAVNYDSAFLMYPVLDPHGKSKSGIASFSAYELSGGIRRSLPIATSLMKLVDLDRCISISYAPVENGKELVLINVHLSAYGNSDEIREGQLRLLRSVMEEEYAKGNYVIVGGDFNHDLKNYSAAGEECESWAYPFPRESLAEGYFFCIDEMSSEERESLWNTSRNADIPYDPENSYTVTLDGFIISDNIECTTYQHLNTGYAYADHEPVYMEFTLKAEP